MEQLETMIRDSDNEAAEALYNANGRDDSIKRLISHLRADRQRGRRDGGWSRTTALPGRHHPARRVHRRRPRRRPEVDRLAARRDAGGPRRPATSASARRSRADRAEDDRHQERLGRPRGRAGVPRQLPGHRRRLDDRRADPLRDRQGLRRTAPRSASRSAEQLREAAGRGSSRRRTAGRSAAAPGPRRRAAARRANSRSPATCRSPSEKSSTRKYDASVAASNGSQRAAAVGHLVQLRQAQVARAQERLVHVLDQAGVGGGEVAPDRPDREDHRQPGPLPPRLAEVGDGEPAAAAPRTARAAPRRRSARRRRPPAASGSGRAGSVK